MILSLQRVPFRHGPIVFCFWIKPRRLTGSDTVNTESGYRQCYKWMQFPKLLKSGRGVFLLHEMQVVLQWVAGDHRSPFCGRISGGRPER